MIYITKQELMDLISAFDEKLERFITSNNPNLFEEEIRLYVPIYDGYEDEIENQRNFYGRNSIIAFEDKFIIAIDHDAVRYIHLCDFGEDHVFVLALSENRDSKVVQLNVEIIELPVEDKAAVSFCKSFPIPINLEVEQDISQVQELWDNYYVKGTRIINTDVESKLFS